MAAGPRYFKAEEKEPELRSKLLELAAFLASSPAEDEKITNPSIPPAPVSNVNGGAIPIPARNWDPKITFIRNIILLEITGKRHILPDKDTAKRIIEAFKPEEQLNAAEKVKRYLQNQINTHIGNEKKDLDIRDYINNTPILSYFLNYGMTARPAPTP